ncbi:MAG: Ig-like domain-containing protein, partial [Bacteroidota bacterium]
DDSLALTGLAAGVYHLTITDANGCTTSFDNLLVGDDCSTTCVTPVIDTAWTTATNCGTNDGSIRVLMQEADSNYLFLWSPAAADTSYLEGLSAGLYEVTIANVDDPSCQIEETFVVGSINGPSAVIDTIAPARCQQSDGMVVFSPDSYDYLWNNGSNSAIRTDLMAGTYFVTVTDSTGCFNIMEVLIEESCPSIDTVWVTTIEDTPIDSICPPLDELIDDLEDAFACELPEHGSWVIDPVTGCATYQPDSAYVGMDTACIIVCDRLGVCDTLVVIIEVLPVGCDDLVSDSLLIELSDCSASAELCVNLPLEERRLYEITLDGEIYDGPVRPCAFDTLSAYVLIGLPGQGNDGPYRLDNWMINGQSFSTSFVTVEQLLDSMNRWDVDGAWTLDAATMVIRGGSTANVYGGMEITQEATLIRTSVDERPDYIARGTAIPVERGQHKLVFRHLLTGCMDSTEVDVICISPDVIRDTILLGSIDTICIDTIELAGNIVSFENFCEEGSGEYVLYELQSGEYCLTYEGVDIGTDSACIVICDDTGLCDTTHIYVTVIEPDPSGGGDPPIAVNDSDTTAMNTPIVITVLTNDTTNGPLDTIYILDQPLYGGALVDASGHVNYTPDQDHCNDEGPDSLRYVICNNYGCDTATVYISIPCEGVVIYTGVSPNDDGYNDVFYIQGIEKYPNNNHNN